MRMCEYVYEGPQDKIMLKFKNKILELLISPQIN